MLYIRGIVKKIIDTLKDLNQLISRYDATAYLDFGVDSSEHELGICIQFKHSHDMKMSVNWS